MTKSQQNEAVIWKNRGNALFKQNKIEEALSCFDYGLDLDPFNANLWNNKGFALYKLGRKEEAQFCKKQIILLENHIPSEKIIPVAKEQPITEEKRPQISSALVESPGKSIVDSPISIQEASENTPIGKAEIHGISGSTHQLLKGIPEINGKKITTLKEIYQFYGNYENILAEAEKTTRQQLDQRLHELNFEETRLDNFIRNGITRRTLEVDANLSDLKNKGNESLNIFSKLGYQLRYQVEVSLRSYRITTKFTGESEELKKVRTQKNNLVSNKEKVINAECRKVSEAYHYLEQNKTFLIGAQGEELVIRVLSGLPEGYHILNDINLHFSPAIYRKATNDHIKSSQIDHIVVGPTGLFLVETKKWKSSDIQLKSEDLLFQVRRSNFALWVFLQNYYQTKNMPKIRNVIVATQGFESYHKLDNYIDVITPDQLTSYITRREHIFFKDDIENLVSTIPWHVPQ